MTYIRNADWRSVRLGKWGRRVREIAYAVARASNIGSSAGPATPCGRFVTGSVFLSSHTEFGCSAATEMVPSFTVLRVSSGHIAVESLVTSPASAKMATNSNVTGPNHHRFPSSFFLSLPLTERSASLRPTSGGDDAVRLRGKRHLRYHAHEIVCASPALRAGGCDYGNSNSNCASGSKICRLFLVSALDEAGRA